MQNIFLYQDERGSSAAAAALEILAIPPGGASRLINRALSGSEAPGTSIEFLCLSDNRERGRARLLLLLRAFGRSAFAASDDILLRRDALSQWLVREGFRVGSLDEAAWREVRRRLSARQNLSLCYPGENLRQVRECYAPGGYDALRQPFDLRELFGALSGGENAGFSAQMLSAGLLPEEEQIILSNLDWLRRNFHSADGAQAVRAFEAALSLRETRPWFVNLTLWGDDVAMTTMVQSLRQQGLTVLTLPMGMLDKADYLGDAPRRLSDYTARAAHALPGGGVIPRHCERLNHLASTRTLTALMTRARDRDPLPGLTVNNTPDGGVNLPEQFTGEGIELGRTQTGTQRVCVPLDRWSKHAVVVGMPGTGKTTFAFHLLTQLNQFKIPFLAVEPSKTEYRALMDVIPDLKVYTPGNSSVAPLMFNPFTPPAGIPLEKYISGLETAFLTAFSLFSPLDVIFPEVLRTCYARYGWRMDSTRESKGAKAFGMREFIAVFREEAQRSGYDGESRANLESGGVYRFQSLLNSNSVLFDTDRPLPTDELLHRPVLIELDAITNPEQKSLLLSLLLIQLNLVIRRDQAQDGTLKNVIMIDEAHVLLGQRRGVREARDADPSGRAVATLQQMVLENRAFGSAMVFADQSPGKLTDDIVGNVDIQLIFRLSSALDRRMLIQNMNLSPALESAIESLSVGRCYLKASGLEQPVLLTTPDPRQSMSLRPVVPDDDVRARYGNVPTPFAACPCPACDIGTRNAAEYIARRITDAHRSEFADRESAERFIREGMMTELRAMVDEQPHDARLFDCAKMFLLRRMKDALVAAGR